MASRFKTGGRRTRAALVAGGLLGALVSATGGVPAQAQADFPGPAVYSGYSTGSALHVDALQLGDTGPRIADASIAFSGETVNTAGLGTPVINEMNVAVQPEPSAQLGSLASKNSYGRGAGAEVGLGSDLPDPERDLILAGLAEGAAAPAVRSDAPDGTPPNAFDTGLITQTVGPVPAGPLLYADVLTGQAQAAWNPNSCILGQPIAYGRGHAANAQLIDAGTPADGSDELGAPVVSATSNDASRAVSTSKSFTYLKSNGDGTYGLVSETRQTYAPVTLFRDPTGTLPADSGAITIELLGEWVLRVTATGKGPATVHYGPGTTNPSTPVLSIFPPGVTDPVEATIIQLQDITGDTGIVIPALPLAQIVIGEDPRAISAPGAAPDPESAPTTTVTEGSAAVDVVSVRLLDPTAPDPSTAKLADVRIGHMEAKVNVPEGGIRCRIPVTKTGAASVNAGEDITYTISVPSNPEALLGSKCDLVNISADDTFRTISGNAGLSFLTASNGGVISGDKKSIHWDNIGSYKPGDPPIVLTVTARATGSGRLENVVNVTASLGNCTGGAQGGTLVGLAELNGSGVSGNNATIVGTGVAGATNVAVLAARLPTTGGSSALTFLGIGAMLTAAGVYLFNRKVSGSTS